MPNVPTAGIVLAAGKGTRMKSEMPKGLFPVCGVPMVELVGRAMKGAGVESPIIVIGHDGERVQEALGSSYRYVWQRDQLGTGHAAMMASGLLQDHRGPVLVAPGDAPLITAEALQELLNVHSSGNVQCTMAVTRMHDPTGYGRVLRDPRGKAQKIVEEKDASPRIRVIQEVCVSFYCFDGPSLFRLLPSLSTSNAQGEYYLTDMVEAIYNAGGVVETQSFHNPELLQGVNDRWQLAEASNILRRRILRSHCLNGVTIVDPDSTFISYDVEIGPDTVIEPNCSVSGGSRIGAECSIGPMTCISKSEVGDRCHILMSHVNGATIHDGVRVGPYANLRPGCDIGAGAKIGNFVEVKNSQIGERASMSHLSYVGDASVGADANIGAGTITCNFDGFTKSRTEIGANAFVGSNSTLVAPVSIGEGAVVAAGSVITSSVPADGLGIARERQEVKEEWAVKWRRRKQAECR